MLSHFSRVWLCTAPWTVVCHASLSMGFSSQEYWGGLLCPPPGDLPHPGIEPTSLMSTCTGRRVLYQVGRNFRFVLNIPWRAPFRNYCPEFLDLQSGSANSSTISPFWLNCKFVVTGGHTFYFIELGNWKETLNSLIPISTLKSEFLQASLCLRHICWWES